MMLCKYIDKKVYNSYSIDFFKFLVNVPINDIFHLLFIYSQLTCFELKICMPFLNGSGWFVNKVNFIDRFEDKSFDTNFA